MAKKQEHTEEKRTRASNGDGTIRQRSDGRWEGRYTAPSGKQKSVYAKSEKACKAALKRVQSQIELGVYTEASKITVEQWLNAWIKDYSTQLKPSTRLNYSLYIKNHLTPLLGKHKLTSLKTIHVQAAFNRMSKDLSASTLHSVKIALSSALTAAVKYDLMSSNPCAGVTIARPEKQDIVIVDRESISAFVREAKKDKYGTALLLLLQTGMRTGELRGLRWSDIDFDNKTITIRQQLGNSENGTIVQSTKGNRFRRIVMIDETVDLLKQHKRQQAEMRIKSGKWVDTDITSDLVFRRSNGDFYSISMLFYHVKRIGEAIGIKGLHPHSLRDSYAVAALRSGIEVKTVQNNLGHADAAMTLNTYATYTDDMGRVAAEKFSVYWRENAN